MAAIKGKDTKPEKLLRSLLHKAGYRFRKNYPSLPGKPDVAFTKKKKVIFMHGCFWHNHGCPNGMMPRSRTSYWHPKLLANKQRDKRNIRKLQRAGWSVMVVWECQILETDLLFKKITKFLTKNKSRHSMG
jgi:DNA mismatch endonuclease (patch repair protein)